MGYGVECGYGVMCKVCGCMGWHVGMWNCVWACDMVQSMCVWDRIMGVETIACEVCYNSSI